MTRSRFLIWLTLGVLVLCCFCQVEGAYADFLYEGKSSDIFKGETTKIKNKKKLKEIVKKVKKDKEIDKLLINVTSPESSKAADSKDSKPLQLGEKRFEVLKDYFTKKLPGIQVLGLGTTIPVTEGAKANPFQDILSIQAGYGQKTLKPGEPLPTPEYPKKENWKRALRERYRKVEEEHRYLCEIPFKNIQSADNGCDSTTQSNKDFNLCIAKAQKYISTDNRHESVRGAKYDHERIRVLEKTSEEVYEIAKEIQENDPSIGMLRYNGRFIADEVKNSLLEVKYNMKALEIVEMAMKHLTEFSGEDKDVPPIANAYHSWWVIVSGYGAYYASVTRRENIDHIRELHNYVRRGLRLQVAEGNLEFPICVETSMIYNNKTLSSIDENYKTSVVPRLHNNGIADFPLTDLID